MRIPLLPDEERYTLDAHRDLESPPVFVFRPPNHRETVAIWAKASQAENVPMGDIYLDLFEERLIRIEGLEIGEEPYEHPKHLPHIPADWQIEVGRAVFEYRNLPETELGKSSSPSDSGGTTATT